MNKLPSYAKAYVNRQDGISISARSMYLQEESNLIRNRHVFRYEIIFDNSREQPIRILRRYWAVMDAHNEKYEVSGEGIIGKKTFIKPGKSFAYNSFCVLYTFTGSMKGFYTVKCGNAEINIRTPRFHLHSHLLN